MPSVIAVFVVTAIALGASGVLQRKDAGRNGPGEKIGLKQWWVVLAAVMGAVEVFAGVGQLVPEPSVDNAFALAIIGGGGLLVIAGSWFRSRSASTGDWMIVVGLLPFLTLFWLIVPPVLAIVVMTMALIDSARMLKVQTT